jgi:hypothetical protein
MGFRGQCARQQSSAAHVRFGSKADIALGPRHVRFTHIDERDCHVRLVPIADIGLLIRPSRRQSKVCQVEL